MREKISQNKMKLMDHNNIKKGRQEGSCSPAGAISFSSGLLSQYPCKYCTKLFSSRQALNGHLRVHAELRRFLEPPSELVSTSGRMKWSAEETAYCVRAYRMLSHEECVPTEVHKKLLEWGYSRSYESVRKFLRTKKFADELERSTKTTVTHVVAEEVVSHDDNSAVNGASDLEGVLPTLRSLMESQVDKVGQLEQQINVVVESILAGETSKESLSELTSNLLENWAAKFAPKRKQRKFNKTLESGQKKMSSRARKAMMYKFDRQAWNKDRSRTANRILNGPVQGCKRPDEIPEFLPYWSKTFEKFESSGVNAVNMTLTRDSYQIWSGISLGEVKVAVSGMKSRTASGPDGISCEELKAQHPRVLCKLVNTFIYLGGVPSILKRSRVTFIPKKDNASSPRDYRPISVTSVILRLFNKILAKRVIDSAQFDHRQRAFRPVDGCAENVMAIEGVLNDARKMHRSVYMASLDMSNAYSSVSHEALLKALESNGACRGLLGYIEDLYSGFTTLLSDGEKEQSVQVERGVMQGDPLSPVLFNMVIDQLLNHIPEEGGYQIAEGVRMNGCAFADDLNIIAATPPGLRMALTEIEVNGRPWGLEFNEKKCSYLAVRAIRGKETVVETDHVFNINNKPIPATKATDIWKYLGAYFSADGLQDAPDMLSVWLERLKGAKFLKPQEKIYVLRVHIIPRLIHRLCMSNLSASKLNSMDRKIRAAINGTQGFAHLSSRTPIHFYYAPGKSGGLGLMRLRHSVPAMVLGRFGALKDSQDNVLKTIANLSANVLRCKKAESLLVQFGDVRSSGVELLVGRSRGQISEINRLSLVESTVSGRGLKHAGEVPQVHSWVTNGSTAFFTGREYCDALSLRLDALHCRVRACRINRTSNFTCRAGCPEAENNYHQIQRCIRSHGMRMRRHKTIVDALVKKLLQMGFEVRKEECFKTSEGNRFPDVVAVKNGKVFVIDPSIVGDTLDPNVWHDAKKNKYETCLKDILQAQYPDHDIFFGGLAITYKGVLASKSAQYMREVGLSNGFLKLVTMMTIRGSLLCHWATQASTIVK